MTWLRNTGFVVSLALVAFIAFQFAARRNVEQRSRSLVDFAAFEDSPSEGEFRIVTPSDFVDAGMPEFPSRTSAFRDVILAMEIHEDGYESEQKLRVSDPPTAVPAPADAAPLETPERNDDSTDNSAVRDVIERELAHAPREERDIWFDELKTLPAGVVRDLLQVRKQLRALPRLLGGMPEKLASADPSVTTHAREVSAEPVSQKIRFHLSEEYLATAALEAAISQLRHNLMNAATPGFKRLRVTVVDSYSLAASELNSHEESTAESSRGGGVHGEGCRIAPLLIDLKPGVFKKTGRQLDLAIDGDGFFVVRRGDAELLTRCGTLDIDRQRRLCLAIADDSVLIQPTIEIPEDAREIQVSGDGTVTVLQASEPALITVGRLQLARVASPTRLKPVGQTLFAANEDSGPIKTGAPSIGGLGEVQQGFLEQSNVDFQTELYEIEELTSIIKALPFSNSRPITASGPDASPKR